ncbi:MAG: transglycosylase SLT domain-containing protein [Candidatus Melainabacteria bacterium]|nr:transglycosylase SLT domain-containing protein [Candidatus Melainabacteria bacterium]
MNAPPPPPNNPFSFHFGPQRPIPSSASANQKHSGKKQSGGVPRGTPQGTRGRGHQGQTHADGATTSTKPMTDPKNPLRQLGQLLASQPWQWQAKPLTKVLAVSVGLMLSVGSCVGMQQNGSWPWLSNGSGGQGSLVLFDANAGVSQDQARQQFRQALARYRQGQYQQALEGFRALEKPYPALQEVILLHEAEALEKLPREDRVQETLQRLLREKPKSPLAAVATYRLAQSYQRSSQSQQAYETFRLVQKRFPTSEYAKASLYYLGSLMMQQANRQETQANETTQAPQKQQALTLAKQAWEQYLDQAMDGRFALECARQLEVLYQQAGIAPSAADHYRLGMAYSHSDRHFSEAIRHLAKTEVTTVWLPLGLAYMGVGQPKEGLQVLEENLDRAKTPEEGQKALDAMLKAQPGPRDKVALLHRLQAKNLTHGGDYVLWQLAQWDAEHTQDYYNSLLRLYPTSDYAPESSWTQLWQLVESGQHDQFNTRAQDHLKQYPTSRSALAVRFWQGKMAEKTGNRPEAQAIYQQMLKDFNQYANPYYAFRAYGRLAALKTGVDPGWETRPAENNAQYPPAFSIETLDVLPGAPIVGEPSARVLQELQAIGAVEDVLLYTQEILGKTPPVLVAWQQAIQGLRDQSLRSIRDTWIERARFPERHSPLAPKEHTAMLKLLYPVHFAEAISQATRQHPVDAYLVQSLMREESYFNELALSGSNAMGLMQLLPSTAKEVAGWQNETTFQPTDLLIPEKNVSLGVHYLHYLHQQLGGNTSLYAVGAYNGGPNAMKRWKDQFGKQDPDWFVESIPYAESRNYIKKVFGSYWMYHQLYVPNRYPSL